MQAEGARMIEQKVAIAAEKCSNGWIEISCFYIIFGHCREIIKSELSNKEAQTKLVENMLRRKIKTNIMSGTRAALLCEST
jgi:F-type H+-transporting ATPase subunit b